jgi:molybdopterin molybdotransferase
MRPFQSTIQLDEARRRLMEAVRSIERSERVPLHHADGRVVAEDVVAPLDVPPFDRSAMDGYAVRASDTAGATPSTPRTLRLAGRAYTAEPFAGTLEPGDCVEIATGAPLPASADAVVMVEDTGRPGSPDWPAPAWLDSQDAVLVLTEAQPGQHVVRHGSDMQRGEVVVSAGAVLNASRLGALAAIGLDTVTVYERPIVAIVPTGNEVVPPGQPLPPASIYDVNSYTLAACVARHGGVPVRLPPVLDTAEAVARALDETQALVLPEKRAAKAAADLIVLAGGSSVGERDVIIDVVRERGDVIFHGIAVKPGKPTALARIGAQLVFGMPGNPTSCLSNAHVLLIPALRAIARLPPAVLASVSCRLASPVSSPHGKHQFLPVRIENGTAIPVFKGSGEITSLSRADGYIEIPADVDALETGTAVTVILY